jgi:hypothetical protein
MAQSIWVNMHDKFMSGWGLAKHGRSLYCIRCDNWPQAEAVMRAAEKRPEMKRLNYADAPRRARGADIVTIKHFSDLGGPWLEFYKEPVAGQPDREAAFHRS